MWEPEKDSYPLPQIQEVIESLISAGHFSYLDLKAGFWQIPMDEALKQYTAFAMGNIGFFEYKHMPFGLCNTLATFQSLMQNCVGEPNLTYCLIYLNDMIIFSKMEEEHLHCLCIVFKCSESTIWNSSQPSMNSSRMRSIIWLTMSPRKV